MNLCNLIQANSVGQYWSTFSRAASSSVAPWSRIILATSLAGLVGIGAYRWSQGSHNVEQNEGENQNFAQVKERICRTYAYVFGGFTITAAAATASHISGLSLKILTNNGYLLPIALSITCLTSLIATMTISKEDQKAKHVAWTIFTTSMGVILSPICFLNTALIAQAAFISLGVGGLLSLTAFLAPDKRFLEWEGPLMTALWSLSIASTVAIFFPQSAFAYGVDRASLYGGLVVFSGLLMSSTQRLALEAETQDERDFDPIRSSLSIYTDMMNLFIRFLRILAENKAKEENG